jgi:hypothetical protein
VCDTRQPAWQRFAAEIPGDKNSGYRLMLRFPLGINHRKTMKRPQKIGRPQRNVQLSKRMTKKPASANIWQNSMGQANIC